jgi:7,8-dihydropterin-6-yl-methyl-4-(beta-D-ribofuranosyl)aminobenzene 5'-phosphate synthase
VIKTGAGLAVICGCAHPGIVEIVQHAKTTFNSDVHLIIGGFHLKDHTAEEARNIILKLKELGVRRIIPFHCTGRIAQRLFTKEYGQDCIMINEGQAIEV